MCTSFFPELSAKNRQVEAQQRREEKEQERNYMTHEGEAAERYAICEHVRGKRPCGLFPFLALFSLANTRKLECAHFEFFFAVDFLGASKKCIILFFLGGNNRACSACTIPVIRGRQLLHSVPHQDETLVLLRLGSLHKPLKKTDPTLHFPQFDYFSLFFLPFV